jgi:hypothetical protein
LNHSQCDETAAAYGFTAAAGTLVIRLGHKPVKGGVMLFATTQVADQTPQMWRQFTVGREAAVSMAATLASEAMEYLEATRGLIRPVEDLDFDDFVQHVAMSTNGELH